MDQTLKTPTTRSQPPAELANIEVSSPANPPDGMGCAIPSIKPKARKAAGSGRLPSPDPAILATADIIGDIKSQMASLTVETWPTDRLRANPRNPRRHTEKQVAQIAASIRNLGFTTPIVVDETGMVLAGHGRLAAAKVLGLDTVPVVQVRYLNEAQKRALVIADNRLAELSDWDTELLRIELEELSALDLSFDIEITGYDTIDIDGLAHVQEDSHKADVADIVPVLEDQLPAVTKLGEIWMLGRHKLICGNALDRSTFRQLMGDERAQLGFTDPPYNVSIAGHVSGTGRYREFAMASGEMSDAEFTAFLKTSFANMAEVSADGSIHYVCMDWRHQPELLAAAAAVYGRPKNMCVWVKTNGGMGSFYRSQHELVYVFKVGEGPHINNFGLGERGRYRSNVWRYPGVNAFGGNRDADLAMHPTVKPVAMVVDALRDCSKKGGVVLDPFGGSGTTLIAAERTGRSARLVELDPLYCDVTLRRWQQFTAKSANLADGRLFDDLARERATAGERDEGLMPAPAVDTRGKA